jgi:phosphatidylserine decarboxylase
MLAVEKDILNAAINPNNLEYLKYNERMLNTIYSPQLDYTYYLVQIADEDVNVIAPFINDQNAPVSQNERFSLIRWGSQVDLVLPLDERYDFDLVLPNEMHVNAGLDKLVKINFKNDPFQ